ncbi:Adaptive-response sensory-kinase SasA [Paenibacillus plantiphilus]|uniref:histidine kinase n=1 Tax=Paenibacillus plantiphilus TaxID=2905650 RepID=A0ABN8GRL1_9BACL|nr:sensor histidine kinase [Paenibacillus plantiphilus]CAH1212480.1 Adaptive-response sensory-kinase SasA [Paenibacillus plantiphilus]
MFFIFFCNLLFAIILYVSQPKGNQANRWMIVFCLSASLGGLSESLISDIIPELELIGAGPRLSMLLFEAHIYSQFLAQVVSPYAILMYAIVYSDIGRSPIRRRLPFILAIPMIAMIVFTDFYPDITINFRVLLPWAAPYILAASWMMLRAWYCENNRYRRKARQNILLVLVPVWLGVLIFNYIARAIDPNSELFRLTPLFFGIAYLLFIGYIFLSGVFGIRIKVEKQQVLDKSIQIMSSGTAILNHTIKNEIEKIKFSFNLAKASLEKEDLEETKASISSVFSAIESIDNMVDRIRSRTEAMIPVETEVPLVPLIRQAIEAVRPLCSFRGIEIRSQLITECTVRCDGILLAEVIKNILNNAMEAIAAPHGMIQVRLFPRKGGVTIEITDNGCGIPREELSRIMEPFFSTKNNIKNHGLGLSFCYMVVRAHDGDMLVRSEVNKGTSVIVKLPKARIVTTANSHSVGIG